MTLRIRFTLLIIGVLVIPVLVLGLSFMLLNNYMSIEDPRTAVKEFSLLIEGLESIDQFSEISRNLDESYFGILVETPEVISFSDKDHDILLNDGIQKLILYSSTKTLKNGSDVLMIFGLKMFDVNGHIFPFLFLGTTLTVLIILSLIIIRSINRSIQKLETATGKIAQGNLDFELDTKGNDRFGSLARSLDTMRHQIKMEYDRRNRFFMGISHDLKTPLSSITGYADALTEGMAEDKKTADKYLGIIKNKAHQLEQRITHLIHYIKLSNSDFQADLEKKSLAVYLEEFLEIQEEEAGFHDFTLIRSINISEDLLIAFDEELLGRALENLIQNGFKYGLNGEAVTVSCRHVENEISINIENKGQVIPADVLPNLFEPFFRGDKSRKSDGFGLGLASVKSIVESHGWSIKVQSENNRTGFIISIPF